MRPLFDRKDYVTQPQPASQPQRCVVALVSELIFQTKITATAEQLGIPVDIVRTTRDAAAAAAQASGLIIDLNLSPDDALTAVRQMKSEYPSLSIVAFCAHVETELIAQANAAGADQVMPRSAFTEQLPQILRRLGPAVRE